ncbi:17650_t:CDS:2, partial [Cetraspora pellucida]
MKNNLKNGNDMHKCKVRIITRVILSMVAERFSVQLCIEGQHIPTNIPIQHEEAITRLNLRRSIRDQVILSQRADGCTAKEVKLKLLAPFNDASKEQLEIEEKYRTNICNEKKLQQLLERNNKYIRGDLGPWTILYGLIIDELKKNGSVLYYQQEDQAAPLNSPQHYYQLTVSDNMWLEQARDYGSFCFGIDAKYDLNNDRAPIHALVVEDCGNCGTPIGFALSNKENMHTIRLAVEAIKANIPCRNVDCEHPYEYITLPNNKGFKHIRSCAIEWKPFAVMNKHRPTKAALKPIIRDTILFWFHIMQTFRNHFRTQKIDWSLRYPIALAFKIVGRCRSVFEAKEMAIEYKSFIYSLPIYIEAKAFFVRNLKENWISQKWILGFIDGGRLPNYEDGTNVRPWTTNNFTERMNRTIEERYSGIQTLVFNAGLVTYWNSRTIEHQNGLYRPQPDIVHRINQGRLKVLQNYVIEVPDKQNLFYVRMSNSQQNTFRSPYTADKI